MALEEEFDLEIKAKNLPQSVEEKALKEISRLDKINPSSPDYSIILNYLDWIKDLPFTDRTVDTEDLKKAKEEKAQKIEQLLEKIVGENTCDV